MISLPLHTVAKVKSGQAFLGSRNAPSRWKGDKKKRARCFGCPVHTRNSAQASAASEAVAPVCLTQAVLLGSRAAGGGTHTLPEQAGT